MVFDGVANPLTRFFRDHERFTPLDLMYEEMPEALLYNLSQSGVTSYGNLKQKNVTVRLDFG